MELVACALILLAVLERLWKWAAKVRRSGRSISFVSAAGVDEFTAAFHGTKHVQLKQRQREEMLRDDGKSEGAPPAPRVDLSLGKIVIRR